MKNRSKQQWQEIINRQQQSGISAAQFCRNEKIDQKYFSTRKRQLLKELKNAPQPFTRVKLKHSKSHDVTFEYKYKNSTLKFEKLPSVKWLGELLSSLS